MDSTIAFLGAGRIAEAWIERLIGSKALPADRILVCDPLNGRLNQLHARYPGLNTSANNLDGAHFGRIVVIATPPAEIIRELAVLRPALQRDAIVISLAAGVPLGRLVKTAASATVVRIMPNTPSMVGEGMNVVCYLPGTLVSTRQEIESLLAIFGRSQEISEQDMEAYGALCSVAPTFLFPIVETLIVSAVEAGLPESLGRLAVVQVFVGTGGLVAASGHSVAELNNMIGLHTLREAEVKQLVDAAYRDAFGKLKGLAAKMAEAA